MSRGLQYKTREERNNAQLITIKRAIEKRKAKYRIDNIVKKLSKYSIVDIDVIYKLAIDKKAFEKEANDEQQIE